MTLFLCKQRDLVEVQRDKQRYFQYDVGTEVKTYGDINGRFPDPGVVIVS